MRDDQNFYTIRPAPTYEVLFALDAMLREHGLDLKLVDPGLSTEAIQRHLVEKGPSFFLRQALLREDIYGRRSAMPDVKQWISERLSHLRPRVELVITDPYIFTSSRKDDAVGYALRRQTTSGRRWLGPIPES